MHSAETKTHGLAILAILALLALVALIASGCTQQGLTGAMEEDELYNTNGAGSFDGELLSAAGTDGLISFDPDTVRPVVAADGREDGTRASS